ncbi:MAG: hypothetical protein MUF42_07090 [Cytophagaceae bacterium]|jgi:hypothetical protein|nr:hypothetical protein [Cytophagaceae bacterium]
MCQFTFPFSVSVETLVENATNAIAKAGGSLQGDSLNGKFSVPTMLGDVAGTYVINGQVASFQITDKPMFLPCDMIEEKLGAMLGKTPS